MAKQITSYRVFIASPGGLETERAAFRDAVISHNNTDALARHCHFEAVGWEFTLAGMGRPQEKINKELEECDLFVLMLRDRWGSPTGSSEGYTSGTEEEYRLARRLLKDPKYPMRDIAVLFKAVDQRQLSDPGPQLTKVLDFKKELEGERALLYETFDTTDSFTAKIRKHLAKWTRDHETTNEASPATAAEPTKSPTSNGNLTSTKDDPALAKIEAIYEKGNFTEAEGQLVKDVAERKSLQSFHVYALFLIKAERWSDALAVYEEMYRLAIAGNEWSWASTAIARIAGIHRHDGKPHDAKKFLELAVELGEKSGNGLTEMLAHIWLGDVLNQLDNTEEAKKEYELALELSKIHGNSQNIADLNFKLAKILANLGSPDKAIVHAKTALDIFTKLKDKGSLNAIKHWRRHKKIIIQ